MNNTRKATVDISTQPTLTCDDCGCVMFDKKEVVKVISPLISPTGEQTLYPISIYVCGDCGKIPKLFDKNFNLSKMVPELAHRVCVGDSVDFEEIENDSIATESDVPIETPLIIL